MENNIILSMTKKLTKIMVAIMMVVTMIPIRDAHAADYSLVITNSEGVEADTFVVGEPINVTANSDSGDWVAMYTKGSEDGSSYWFWYYVDGTAAYFNRSWSWENGETYNIYSTVPWAGSEEANYLPAGDYTIRLENHPEVIKTITIVEPESTEKDLDVAETTVKLNEPFKVTATSYSNGSWVGLYSGTRTTSSAYGSDYLYFSYLNGYNGEVFEITAPSEGDYTVVLFSANDYTSASICIPVTVDHTWGEWTYDGADKKTHSHVCANDETHVETYDCTFDEGVVTKEATDTETGVKTYTCSVCGGTYTEEIPATGVTETGSEVIKEATCEEKGTLRTHYSDGTYIDTEIPAKGHAYGEWKHVEGTKTHSKVCANDETHVVTENCTTTNTYDFANNALIHDCSVCGGKYTSPILSTSKEEFVLGEPIYVNATSNIAQDWVGIYNKGDKEGAYWFYYYVSESNGVNRNMYHSTPYSGYAQGTLLPAGEYDVVLYSYNYDERVRITIKVVEPDTYDTSVVVKKDEYSLGETVYSKALSYTSGAWVGTYNGKLTADSSIPTSLHFHYTAGVNGAYFPTGSYTTSGDYTVILFKDSGYTPDKFAYFRVVGEEVSRQRVEPTCDTDGYILITYKDGGTITITAEEDETLKATGHAYGEWTYDGETAKTHTKTCANGDHPVTEDCNFDEGVVTKEATATQKGEITYTCQECGGTYKIETSTAEVTGTEVIKEPTCDQEGTLRTYYSDGSHIDTPISATGHDYENSEWVYDGEEKKTHTHVCANDPAHKETKDCTWDAGTKTSAGILYTCTECKGTYEIKYISTDKLEYKYGEPIMVTTNYNGAGAWVGLYKRGETYNPDAGGVRSIYWYYLSEQTNPVNILATRDENNRGHEYKAGEYTVVLFQGDNYTYFASVDITITKELESEVTVEPTCDDDGSITRTYSDGSIEVEVIPATGHAYGEWTYNGADKKTHSHVCANDETHVETHDCTWNEGVVTKEATETETGIKVYTCTECGGTYEEELPATGATVTGSEVIKEPTCEEEGTLRTYYSDGSYIDTPIAKLGHTYGEWTYDGEEKKTHTHVCANDETHKETENCTFDSGVVANGVITYTCTVCSGTYSVTLISTDKSEYKYGEDILVTVNYVNDNAWVGLYKKGEKAGEGAGTSLSIYWYYVADYENTVNILATRDENNRSGDYVAGEYTIILFKDGGYTELASVNITVTKDVTDVITKEATCTEEGSITTYYSDGTADVEVIPATGHDWNEWTFVSDQFKHVRTCKNDSTHTETEECTFHEEVIKEATETENGIIKYTCETCHGSYEEEYSTGNIISEEVIKEPTCEENGILRVTYENGSVIDKVIPKLGHDYGTWVFNEETHEHTRTCSRDASHTETEECTFEDTINGNEVTHKCKVCNGEFVTGLLTTDKTTYYSNEPVWVTAYTSNSGAWVGLYKKGEKYNPNNGGVVSLYWFWVNDSGNSFGTPVNLLDGAYKAIERNGIDESGEYTVVLFGNDEYSNVLASLDITINIVDTSETIFDVYLNDTQYKYGDDVSYLEGTILNLKVLAEGELGSSWVGLYDRKVGFETNFSSVTSIWWSWIEDVNGRTINLSNLVDFPVGDYSIVIFGNSGYTTVREVINFSISLEASSDIIIKEPTCEDYGVRYVVYEDGSYAYIPIAPLGHDMDNCVHKEDTHTHSATCKRCGKEVVEDCLFDQEVIEEATDTENGQVKYTCGVCGYSYVETIPATGEVETTVDRIYGETRYETSLKIADELKATLGVDKFDVIIVTTGNGFADALSGSYLASINNAPILIVNAKSMDLVKTYIKENLKEGGVVYILGGENAVSKDMETGLDGFTVKRLAGKTRYETNIEILKEANVKSEDLVICTGTGFADALSVSATNKPIMLVNKTITEEQKQFLASLDDVNFYIIGGNAAISYELESEIRSNYGGTMRIGGATRYETSVLIAKTFFKAVDTVVLAYSLEFPDGLCGGALASKCGPLILVNSNNYEDAKNYVEENNVHKGVVLGGEIRITDEVVKSIFGLDETDTINVK